jgi:hypothetical protein
MDLSTIIIIVSVIFTAFIGPYVIYRLNKQDAKTSKSDKAIDRIEVHVNSRLDAAVDEIAKLRAIVTTSQVSGEAVPDHADIKPIPTNGE